MGWKTKRLGELCDVFTDGNWIETKDQSSSGVRLIQTGNVGIGVFKDRADKARFISEDTFSRLKCTEIFPGDCLISRLPDPAGRACVVPETGSKMITAVDCTIVRFKNNIVMPDFFNYFSQSKDYLAGVDVRTSGATRKRISRKNLGQVEIPVPSLAEQKQIVAILDEAFANIDHARQLAERNFNNARELFDSTLNQLFSQRGDGWIEQRFHEVCILQRGFDLPTRLRKSGSFPLLSANGVTDHIDRWKVTGPGVITGRSGTVGKVHFIETDFWPLNTALYIKDFHGNSEKFIYYFLRFFDLSKFVSGAGVPTLNRNNVHHEICWIPLDKDSQNEIVEKLEYLSHEVAELEKIYRQKITALDELKQSLLQKAFRGELSQAQSSAA